MAVTFIYPIAGASPSDITSGFGWRTNPITGESQFHNGIDFGFPAGTPILAIESGTVITSTYDQWRGWYVDIQHSDNYRSRYQHNQSQMISVGTEVVQGQTIARVGNTGDSTGPHLHLEIHLNGTPVDPEPLLGGAPSSPTHSSNSYFADFGQEQTDNAQYILSYLVVVFGWTKEAACGFLGNVQVESTINPGIWQDLNAGNMSGGFGLVQWTPASNYINWAISNDYTTYEQYGQIDPQLLRIQYELNNGLQWISTSEYPISFEEFTQSTESPEYLASAFLKNYERAGVEAEAIRRSNARYWYDNLTPGGIEPPLVDSRRSKIWIKLWP